MSDLSDGHSVRGSLLSRHQVSVSHMALGGTPFLMFAVIEVVFSPGEVIETHQLTV